MTVVKNIMFIILCYNNIMFELISNTYLFAVNEEKDIHIDMKLQNICGLTSTISAVDF